MRCSNAAFIIALIYIDRLQERLQDFFLNHYCIHKYLLFYEEYLLVQLCWQPNITTINTLRISIMRG